MLPAGAFVHHFFQGVPVGSDRLGGWAEKHRIVLVQQGIDVGVRVPVELGSHVSVGPDIGHAQLYLGEEPTHTHVRQHRKFPGKAGYRRNRYPAIDQESRIIIVIKDLVGKFAPLSGNLDQGIPFPGSATAGIVSS